VKKLPKIVCEVCGQGKNNPEILIKHHIKERNEADCVNHSLNLAIICANCHSKVHLGNLKIYGFVISTGSNGRTLIYEENGKRNIEGIEPLPIPALPNIKIRSK